MASIQMNRIDGYLVFSCVIVKIHRNKFLKQEYMMIILMGRFSQQPLLQRNMRTGDCSRL